MQQTIDAQHVERIGPVVQLARTREPGTGWDSFTVMFPVRADGEVQMWIQRWEAS